MYCSYDEPSPLGSDLSYKCTCIAHGQTHQPQPRTSLLHTIAAGEPRPLKRRQSDLAIWAGLKPKNVVLSTTKCKGRIVVSAEDDDSHPVGIKGQRITVKVEH
jgi:hypothetical protein